LKCFLGPTHENVIINGYVNEQDGISYYFFDLDPKQLQNLKISELLPDAIDLDDKLSPDAIDLDDKLSPEVNGSVYPVFANVLFSPEPDEGGRGDPFIWRGMSASLETTCLPKDKRQLKELLVTTFEKCTGHKFGSNVYFPDSRMGSLGAHWQASLMPMLLDRFKPIPLQQNLAQLKFSILLTGSIQLGFMFNKLPNDIILVIGKKLLDVSLPKVSRSSEEMRSNTDKYLSELPKPL